MRTIRLIYDLIPQVLSYSGCPDVPSTGVTYTVLLPIPARSFVQIS